MINKLDEMEILDFLDRFEQNQLEKRVVLEFIMKLVNGYLMMEKSLLEEIEYLRKSISTQQIEVSTLILNSIEKQEFLNIIANGLNEIKDLNSGKNFVIVSKLQNLILNNSIFTEDSWNFLNKHFLTHHKVDLKNALKIYNLSDTELKICSLIFLDFTTKEISKILNVSSKSVETQKYRIKKKMGLDKDEKLKDFINNLMFI